MSVKNIEIEIEETKKLYNILKVEFSSNWLELIHKIILKLGLKNNEESICRLKFILGNMDKFPIPTQNDLLRCMVKKVYADKCDNPQESEYFKLELEPHNLFSNGSIAEYDPAKNGENILKHGLDFHSVTSFARSDFGRYLIKIPCQNNEERVIVFSKYEVNEQSKLFLLEPHKERDILQVVSIVVNVWDSTNFSSKFRFISSRTINADSHKKLLEKVRDLLRPSVLDEFETEAIINRTTQNLLEYYNIKS